MATSTTLAATLAATITIPIPTTSTANTLAIPAANCRVSPTCYLLPAT